MGRTRRHRTKKKRQSHLFGTGRSGCDMKTLLQFMGREGFSSNDLRLHNFSDTGRGMMALKTLNKDDLLISIPKNLLIGVKRAIMVSTWAQDLSKVIINLSSMQFLCVFLLEGKNEVLKKRNFCLSSYIKSLPEKFRHHIFWSYHMLHCLPRFIYEKAKLMRDKVWEDFVQLKNSIPPDHEMKQHINWYSYRWAWCCVNSRCIYSNHEKLPDWNFLSSSDADHYYLAPYLDMFNHSPQAKVVGSYNEKSQSYEIKSLQKWRKYEQIFICYGPHSTESLFLEYGFICPGENINDVVAIPKSILYNCDHRKLCHPCLKTFENFLETQKLFEGWHIEKGQVSFNAQTSIALYIIILSKCNNNNCLPHILTKHQITSTLVLIQNGNIPKQLKCAVEIAQSNLCDAMHDIIHNDILNAKCLIKLHKCSNELDIIEALFKMLLTNVSTGESEYNVDLLH